MSGHMDEERVRKLLPSMVKKAEKKGRILEILFHPGRVLEEEISEEFSQKEVQSYFMFQKIGKLRKLQS